MRHSVIQLFSSTDVYIPLHCPSKLRDDASSPNLTTSFDYLLCFPEAPYCSQICPQSLSIIIGLKACVISRLPVRLSMYLHTFT